LNALVAYVKSLAQPPAGQTTNTAAVVAPQEPKVQ
jgi:hypothetical protein